MKKLYILRHAAADYYASCDDKDRDLEYIGEMDAHKLGKELKARGVNFDAIKCSTAARTMQTLDIVRKELGYDGAVSYDDDLYSFDTRSVLDVLAGYDDTLQNLLIVAHNPVCSELVWYLSTDRVHIQFDTCNFAALEYDGDKWAELAEGASCRLDYIIKPRYI